MSDHPYQAAKKWHWIYRDTPHQKHRLAPIPVADMLAMARAVLDTQAVLDHLEGLSSRELEKRHSTDLDVRATYRDDYVTALDEACAAIEYALDGEGGAG